MHVLVLEERSWRRSLSDSRSFNALCRVNPLEFLDESYIATARIEQPMIWTATRETETELTAFYYAAPAAWNTSNIVAAISYNTETFKRHLKTFLFCQAFLTSIFSFIVSVVFRNFLAFSFFVNHLSHSVQVRFYDWLIDWLIDRLIGSSVGEDFPILACVVVIQR